MVLKPYSNIDFDRIACIHKYAFNESDFLSSCSKQIIKYFYQSVSISSSNIILGWYDQDRIIRGFIFCTLNKDLYLLNFLKKYSYHFFCHPSYFYPLLKAFLKKFFSPKLPPYKTELVYIAVDNNFTNRGIGNELLKTLFDELKRMRINTLFLQVFKENVKAIKLYQNHGFVVENKFIVGKRTKLLMRKNL